MFHGQVGGRTLHPRPPPAGLRAWEGARSGLQVWQLFLGGRHATAAWSDVALSACGSLRKRPRSFGVNGAISEAGLMTDPNA